VQLTADRPRWVISSRSPATPVSDSPRLARRMAPMSGVPALHASRAGQRRSFTGAWTAFAVMLALCQSLSRNPGRIQAQAPCFPTGPPATPHSLPSCEWLRPTPWSSCVSGRVAAATTASPAVECRPIRPVRAGPPQMIILITTTTGTAPINPAADRPEAHTPASAAMCRRA
jgi:hypothetical protein